MKKFIQISLAIVVTFTLLVGVFQLAPDAWINVGWNSGVSTSAPQGQSLASCMLCDLKADLEFSPNVGWNSGI